MGRTDYSAIGYGMTVQEARRDAIDKDRIKNGHQEGYSGTIGSATGEEDKVECLIQPKPAKKVKVEKSKTSKTKWVTAYILSGLHNTTFIGSKSEAIKHAKELALRNACQYHVVLTKVPQDSLNAKLTVAVVTPRQSQLGKWRFSGLAMC